MFIFVHCPSLRLGGRPFLGHPSLTKKESRGKRRAGGRGDGESPPGVAIPAAGYPAGGAEGGAGGGLEENQGRGSELDARKREVAEQEHKMMEGGGCDSPQAAQGHPRL